MLTFHDIEQARERIASEILLSPCAYSDTISQLAKCRVYFKLESLQKTGSFKERGALNKILSLTPQERARGVIAASAGNHAQGVAYHCLRQGVRAVIVMPVHTPLIKVDATRSFGAEVVLAGENYDAAFEEALRRMDAEGLVLIHPFNDPIVMAGQGT